MIERRLGNSDIACSLIGYGAWKAGRAGWPGAEDKATMEAIAAAVDLGINYFDTAPVYGFGHSEEVLGKALAGRRGEVYLATKVGLVWDDSGNVRRHLAPESVRQEIDDSLRRLGTDHVDLIQVHWNDHETPIEAVMEVFTEAREQGKVRHFGVCNLDPATMDRARGVAEVVSAQVLYNLIDRNAERYLVEELEYRTEDEIVPYCRSKGMGLIPYSPLGQGFLSDGFDSRALEKSDIRRLNRMFEASAARREELQQVAGDLGMSLSELAIAWLARQKVVSSLIVGSTNPAHIEANIRALDRMDEVLEGL